MTTGSHFALIVLIAALAGFLLFGGAGLIVVAVAAYFWHLAPYRRGNHSNLSESHHGVFLSLQDSQQTLPGPARPKRYFLQLLLCAGLAFIGLARLEVPGLLGVAI